ncbi:MAG TPA: hypothetical protein DIT22_04785, partial [Thermodesulfobacterium commune]|nr:hypothetical protein [Thermodesulfobacterium commune]
MDVSKTKKVLYITGGIGGESRELENHIEIIKTIIKNCEISAVVLYDTFARINHENVKITILKRKRSLNPINKITNLIYWIYEVYKLKKKNKYDICFSNADPSNLVNLISSLLAYKNFDNTILRFAGLISNIDLYQSSKIYGIFYKLFYKINYKLIYNKARKISFISRSSLLDTIRYGIGREKAVVSYNPIDVQKVFSSIDEPLEEFQCVFESPVIINSGRLTQPKGQWYL